jgi:hypothetical protein
VNVDDGVHRDAAVREPGHEEMRSTVETEDVRVDNKLHVSFYHIDV